MQKDMKKYIQPETSIIHVAITNFIADSFHDEEGDGQDAKGNIFDAEELDKPEDLWEQT